MFQFTERLWNLLFPAFCVSCNKPGDWWCARCRKNVEKIQGRICPTCLSLGDHQCSGNLLFKQVWSFGLYHDPILRSVVTKLKFNGVTILKNDLQKFLCSVPTLMIPADAVIVPMPLSEKRLKERGFNQAEYLANIMKEVFKWKNYVDLETIKRVKHRDPQSGMEHEYKLRAGNVFGAFECIKEPPKLVVLVDDVVTTGATASEVAKTLIQAGTKEVSLITLAIGA